MGDRALASGSLTESLFLWRDEISTRGVTDAERITELEEQLRQRDARIAEIERTVGELRTVIDAWKRGHRVRPDGKIAQKPCDKRRATGRGPGRPEGHEGTCRAAPTSADRDVVVPVPETCSCGGLIDPTDEEPGEHFVEEISPASKEVIAMGDGASRYQAGGHVVEEDVDLTPRRRAPAASAHSRAPGCS